VSVGQPDGEDDLKRRQLMELAIINGTYRDTTTAGANTLNTALGPASVIAALPVPISRKSLLTLQRLAGTLLDMTSLCTTHTHPFNGHFSGTTHVSRYQKGKTNLDFTAARDSEWQ